VAERYRKRKEGLKEQIGERLREIERLEKREAEMMGRLQTTIKI